MSKNIKGFTIVEIVVVLSILSVLAGAGIPTMLKYVDKAKEKLCLSNKLTMVRLYKSYSMLYPDHNTLQEVLDGENKFLLSDFESLKCPSGGLLTAADGHIVCNIHDVDLNTNAENPTAENPSDTPRWTIFDNLVVGRADKIFDAAIASNGGIKYESGLVFGKGNEIYIFGHNSQLSQSNAIQYKNNLSSFNSLIKVDTSPSSNWKGGPILNGNFFTDEIGQTWIFINKDSVSENKPTGNGSNSGGWLKLVSGKAYSN